MNRTGVFATDEENKMLMDLMEEARQTPAIAFTTKQALEGHDLASDAWYNLRTKCHEIALKHGLPEIEGFYGIDGKTKEFVSV